jgi:DNA-binding CsgD family transcriptional regulator
MQSPCVGRARETARVGWAGEIVPPGTPAKRRGANATGLVIANARFESLYANDAAVQILSYPAAPPPISDWSALAQKRIRSILMVERFAADEPPASFASGRRRYECRPFLLQSSDRPTIVAILFERLSRDSVDLSEISQRFHLSPREGETVLHLIRGLNTREVAQRMSVSPNTVKQFVRLTMSKMGVTTRLGIISRIMGELF